MAEFESWLDAARAKWKAVAKDVKKQGAGVPEGKYIARLTGAKLTKSSKGAPMLTSSWTIISGTEKGNVARNNDNLREDETSLTYLAKWFYRLKVDPETVDFSSEKTIQKSLDELVKEKPACGVQVKQSGDFTNVWIQRYYGPDYDPDEDDDNDLSSEEDDEKPAASSGSEDDPTDEDDDDSPSDEDEEEEDKPAEPDEVDIEVGMWVKYPWQGAEATGEIKELLPDENKVKVRTEVDGKGKIRTVSAETLVLAPRK